MSNGAIKFYVDTMLVEAILGDEIFYKKAGFVSDVLSKVKNYFESKIDKQNPTTSVMNMLAPGILWATLQSIGLGKWGLLLGLLMDVFHVDVGGMLSSLYEKVKAMISDGKKVSSEQIDEATTSTIEEYNMPVSQDQIQQGYQTLQSMQRQSTYSSLELLDNARIIRLALIQYEDQKLRLTKTSGISDFFKGFQANRSKGSHLLGTIFGWIFKIALFSAGLMVAGAAINSLLGRPSSLKNDPQAIPGSKEGAAHDSTQTKFPLKGDSTLPSQMQIANNPSNIENLIIQFANDVYSGLEGKESIIKSTPGFQMIKDKIIWDNAKHPGSSVTFIPDYWPSKKSLVDYFIDDVAKSAQ